MYMSHLTRITASTLIAALGALLYPITVFAQSITLSFSFFSCPPITDFKSFVIVMFCQIIDPLVTLIIALALVFFLWGGAQFILNAESEEGREKGKQKMTWGIIVLFIMVSIWGIVMMLQNTFFGGAPATAPAFPGVFPGS